ncbi:N-acetylglucosamine kinase [Actinorugispora endophytica]|uniref:N-acetylglucosamine kinase-like BadF-type ATPase n=1 Tax=Actinorugispora endophytica TaxID=1605990 RepID=A0A4R6UD04_9ACTN|nr:BadF/BadG/BcrA/BcrD ATPase family protein [Actinorugispora endophytica]TDQ43912.1 N-acetylglucosamine kinase-like BadF-type ATPase [Actinorugispora endophytica]
MSEEEQVVIGVDAGGTHTRCLVATLDGRVRGRGRAGGANPRSSADPEASLVEVVRRSLPEAGRVRVVGAVFGVAGAGAAGYARIEAAVLGAWRVLGLPGSPHVGDDIVVAFAAGTAEPAGAVLVAGTGAVAAAVREGRVERRCDGHGWLLGDEGSAVWIGVAGLRAALAAMDGRGGGTALTERLAAALGVRAEDRQALVGAAYAVAPAALGGLAPQVCDAAEEGDEAARAIVDEAAARLLSSLAAVVADPLEGPLVLAGAVLERGPVAERLREAASGRYGVRPLAAAPGEFGAAALALRRAGRPTRAHAELIRSAWG